MIFISFESQYVTPYSNLGPILHCLATVHPWWTDGQTDDNHDNHRPLL